jgi:hypothetical protein
MIQHGYGSGFAFETLGKLLPRIAGAIHLTHTTGSDWSQSFIRTEAITWCDRRLKIKLVQFNRAACRSGNARSLTRDINGNKHLPWRLRAFALKGNGGNPLLQ